MLIFDKDFAFASHVQENTNPHTQTDIRTGESVTPTTLSVQEQTRIKQRKALVAAVQKSGGYTTLTPS